jgi:hypothetical protein
LVVKLVVWKAIQKVEQLVVYLVESRVVAKVGMREFLRVVLLAVVSVEKLVVWLGHK